MKTQELHQLRTLGATLRNRGKITSCQHRAWLATLDHLGPSGQCNPRYETIARKADCSRRTVANAMQRMKALGLVNWTNERVQVAVANRRVPQQTSNEYFFPAVAAGTPDAIDLAIANMDAAAAKAEKDREQREKVEALDIVAPPQDQQSTDLFDAELFARVNGPPLPDDTGSRLLAGLSRLSTYVRR